MQLGADTCRPQCLGNDPADTSTDAESQALTFLRLLADPKSLQAQRTAAFHRTHTCISLRAVSGLSCSGASCWDSISKRRFLEDLSGEWVLYTQTGSMFDGLKEYLLLTKIFPAEMPSKTEDIFFRRKSCKSSA